MKKPNVIMSSRKRTNRTVAISCVFMCHPVANTLRATNWNVHTSDIKGMFSNHKFFSSLHLKKSIVFIFKVYQKEWCCRIKIGKKSILTTQLWLKFDFDNRTPKSDIFGHPTIKRVQIWPLGYFDEWFYFLFTVLSLNLKMIIAFCRYLWFKWLLWSHVHDDDLYLLNFSSWYFITICYIILILLWKIII
jgi:hypothetical protein